MTSNTLIALFFAAGMVGASMPAHAGSGAGESAENLALQAAKLTAEDAGKAATAKFPGMVSSVHIYDEAGRQAYHVEIVGADGRQQDLSVDAVSGEVMKMAGGDENDGDGEHHDGSSENDSAEGQE